MKKKNIHSPGNREKPLESNEAQFQIQKICSLVAYIVQASSGDDLPSYSYFDLKILQYLQSLDQSFLKRILFKHSLEMLSNQWDLLKEKGKKQYSVKPSSYFQEAVNDNNFIQENEGEKILPERTLIQEDVSRLLKKNLGDEMSLFIEQWIDLSSFLSSLMSRSKKEQYENIIALYDADGALFLRDIFLISIPKSIS